MTADALRKENDNLKFENVQLESEATNLATKLGLYSVSWEALRKENEELRNYLNKIIEAFSDEAQVDLCDLVMYAADWIGTHPTRIDADKQAEVQS
jgi:5'-deoxynucleotidase YfbR-like HD superfamily hydrolase